MSASAINAASTASSSSSSAADSSCPYNSNNDNRPRFPALYIPHYLDHGGIYICSTYDAWLFTVLWTLLIYAAFYLAAAGYAFLVQAGASAAGGSSLQGDVKEKGKVKGTTSVATPTAGIGSGIGMGTGTAAGPDRGVEGLVQGARRNWRVTLVVGVAYVVVGGVEAVLAGSVVGAILGTVYDAGGFRLSTWVPLVWAVINVVFLILSSFSIQERLL